MDRIIVIGRNDKLPRNAVSRQLRICRDCEGTGRDWVYGNNPSERAFQIICPTCEGQGAIEKEINA
jgi:DnaJ-class molecular chaperone